MANGSAVRIAQVQSGRNAEIVESAYYALNNGDIVALKKLFHEHASWHTPGLSAIAGSRKGRDECAPSSAAMAERPAGLLGRTC